MGVLVAVIGFTSTFAVVLQGFRAVGASEAEAASGLMAVSIAMGLAGMWLAWRYRMPLSVAWSTPGAVLLIGSGDAVPDFASAVGAFAVCAVLLVVAGVFKPLGRAMQAIPASLANAMLAGILLSVCVAPVRALQEQFALAVPVLLTWWLAGRVQRFAAVPAAFAVLIIVIAWRVGLPDGFAAAATEALVPAPVFTLPRFDAAVLLGVALPLFVVTMASQNLPGIAVQKASGYDPAPGPLIATTGIFSLLAAPFGSHAVNLAALTAALCAGPDAHADPARRYWAAIVAGGFYVVFGLFAGLVTLIVTQVPAILIEAIAGLALLGAFSAAVAAAFQDVPRREAAAVTFVFAASGIAFLGVGGAFWGLLAGGAMALVQRKSS